jgi:hypothetical protein
VGRRVFVGVRTEKEVGQLFERGKTMLLEHHLGGFPKLAPNYIIMLTRLVLCMTGVLGLDLNSLSSVQFRRTVLVLGRRVRANSVGSLLGRAAAAFVRFFAFGI